MAKNHNLDLPQLVHAATNGDSAAWSEIVIHVTPILRRAGGGFRLRHDDLEDAIQNTWLQAFTRLHTLRNAEALISWLVVTVRREALRMLQTGMQEILTQENAMPASVDPTTIEDIVLQRERDSVLRSAVERLPQRQRSLLRRIIAAPGTSYGDLAEQLEMPIGSIGPTRERALTRLRDDAGIADLAA